MPFEPAGPILAASEGCLHSDTRPRSSFCSRGRFSCYPLFFRDMSCTVLAGMLVVAAVAVVLLIARKVWRLGWKQEPADSLWLIDQMVEALEERQNRTEFSPGE